MPLGDFRQCTWHWMKGKFHNELLSNTNNFTNFMRVKACNEHKHTHKKDYSSENVIYWEMFFFGE